MAIKPNRVQAKQVYALINSTPTRRVQSFDWNSSFETDSVFELGNNGVVEESVTAVETNVSMNSFEWGTVDVEAMVFGVFEQRNIRGDNTTAGVTNTTGSIYVASKGAGGNWTNATVGKYLQVIRLNSTATTNDSEYVEIVSKRYAAASQANVFGISPALTAAPATGDVITLVNAYTITQDTVDSNPVHIVVPHRYSSSSTLLMHSILIPRCAVDSLSYTFDVGGAAEQNYTLLGEEERMLLGTRREAQSIVGSFMSYANATVVFRIPYNSLAATGSPYACYAGSNLVSSAITGTGGFSHTSGQVTVQARIGSGLSVDSTTQLVYYYTNKTKKGYRPLTNIDSAIGKLTKGYIVVQMQKQTEGTIQDLQRVQSVSINIPLTRESIDELGESRSIAQPLEANLRNEVTLSFARNDLREFAQLLGYGDEFDAGTLTEILMTDLKSVTNMRIYVKLYNSQTTHTVNTLLKTFQFDDCNFIGTGNTTPISGAAGLDLNFVSQSINIAGSGLPPTVS